MIPHRFYVFLYLLTLFLVGLGYLAIMPVFEGFDEQAHYSYMRQIAGTDTIPVLGESYLDRAYVNYQGPRPYTHKAPPFDSGLVYSKFFNQPDLVASYRRDYRESPSTVSFFPSQDLNWQAQHPPLYYLFMAPLVNAVEKYPFVTQFFVLRLASFLIALTGVALGLLAALRKETPQQTNQAMIGFLLYPIIFPMFFPEFTRIGNDALCIFGVGALAYLLSVWRRDETNLRISLAIGITLGLSLLTKAFFLPILVAFATFLSLRLWLDSRDVATFARRRLSLLCIFYPALLIGGAWYICRYAAGGDISGGIDAVILAHRGGLIDGLKTNFTFYALARSIISTIFTTTWSSTWSLAYLPLRLHIPLLALIFWIFRSYALQLKQRRIADFAWLPVLLFVFFGMGLFYHLMIGLALDGKGQTPGWYLHILMPMTAPAVGMGVCPLLQNHRARPWAIGLLLYAGLFHVMALWAQFALFTGCATKGNDTHYAFPGHTFCLDQAPLLMDRLSVLGWPALAAVGFGGGIACAIALSKYTLTYRRSLLSCAHEKA